MKHYFHLLTLSFLVTPSVLNAGKDTPALIMKEEDEIKTPLHSQLNIPQKDLEPTGGKKEISASCKLNLLKVYDISEVPSHREDIILEYVTQDKILERAMQTLREEAQGKQCDFIPHCSYLTPTEAKSLLTLRLEELLTNSPDKEKIRSQIFTERFFGHDYEQVRLKSLWEACTKIFTSKLDWDSEYSSVKTKEEFIRFLREGWGKVKIDLFLGNTPEEIRKAHQLCAQAWKEDNGIPLKNFLNGCPDFPTYEEFYALFGSTDLFFSSEAKLEEYLLQNDYGFITRADIQELVLASQKILGVTQEGDTLIIFGNTPALLGRILEKIAGGNRNIIFFPFSGSPNRCRMVNYIEHKDIVTEERWTYFKKNYMTAKGLSFENPQFKDKTIWLIDLIVSGGGPAYFLETLIAQYHHHKPVPLPLPNIQVIALNEIHKRWKGEDNWKEHAKKTDDSRIEDIYKGDNHLYFPTKWRLHFSVPVTEIPLKCSDKLDSPAEYQRILPPYNGMYWSAAYENHLYKPESLYLKMFLKYFDLNIKKFLQEQ